MPTVSRPAAMRRPCAATLRPFAAACLATLLLAAPASAATGQAAPPPAAAPAEDDGGTPPDPTADPSPTTVPAAESPSDAPAATDAPSPTVPAGEPAPTAEPTPPDDAAQPSPTPSGGTDGAAPSPSVAPSPGTDAPVTAPPWAGRLNVYRSGAWVRQYTSYTCTAASVQTMLNIVRHRSDRTVITQMRIIRWERAHDRINGRGSDPEGWAAAMRHYGGGGSYAWKTFHSRAAALRYAAKRIATTHRPVGLLVWRGRHAWTMTGFKSATDPRTDPVAVIDGIYVAPPLVGTDPRPNSYLPASGLGTFARYLERDGLRAWVDHWVVVAP